MRPSIGCAIIIICSVIKHKIVRKLNPLSGCQWTLRVSLAERALQPVAGLNSINLITIQCHALSKREDAHLRLLKGVDWFKAREVPRG